MGLFGNFMHRMTMSQPNPVRPRISVSQQGPGMGLSSFMGGVDPRMPQSMQSQPQIYQQPMNTSQSFPMMPRPSFNRRVQV